MLVTRPGEVKRFARLANWSVRYQDFCGIRARRSGGGSRHAPLLGTPAKPFCSVRAVDSGVHDARFLEHAPPDKILRMQRDRSTAPYDQALGFLLGRTDFERMLHAPYGRRDFKLDRMRELAERLGNPQQRMTIVHIAGTKGKGSTAAMTAAMLSAAGYRTGLYTSPHLDRLEERIVIDGRECPPAALIDLVARVRPAVEAMDRAAESDSHGPTYFEILTALALLHFVDQQVDLAVLEVGLGGRLDSTNICRPAVSVVTSISYDHTRQLGNTLTAIAGEKAGIIKPGIPVVSGVLDPEPQRVIARIAAQLGCRLSQLGQQFDFDYYPAERLEQSERRSTIDFRYLDGDAAHGYSGLELALIGSHQAANAAVALATIAELRPLGYVVAEAAIRRGLAEVRWPARVEVLKRRPTLVLDAAHNVASVESFVSALGAKFLGQRPDFGLRHHARQGCRGHAPGVATLFRAGHFDALYEQSARTSRRGTGAPSRSAQRQALADRRRPGRRMAGRLSALERRKPDRHHGLILHSRRDAIAN